VVTITFCKPVHDQIDNSQLESTHGNEGNELAPAYYGIEGTPSAARFCENSVQDYTGTFAKIRFIYKSLKKITSGVDFFRGGDQVALAETFLDPKTNQQKFKVVFVGNLSGERDVWRGYTCELTDAQFEGLKKKRVPPQNSCLSFKNIPNCYTGDLALFGTKLPAGILNARDTYMAKVKAEEKMRTDAEKRAEEKIEAKFTTECAKKHGKTVFAGFDPVCRVYGAPVNQCQHPYVDYEKMDDGSLWVSDDGNSSSKPEMACDYQCEDHPQICQK